MSKNILIVDDEPDIVKVLALRLIDSGFEVQIAYSGQDALKRISQNLPDLIVLDIMMPEMSGAELAEKLSDDKKTAQIPIIFLTALQSKEEEQKQGTIIGKNIILAKPYDINHLIAEIHARLDK